MRRARARERRAELALIRHEAETDAARRSLRKHERLLLGEIVERSGLAKAAGDDAEALLGGMMALAETLQGEERASILRLWKMRARRRPKSA